jgi:hypothetical protein
MDPQSHQLLDQIDHGKVVEFVQPHLFTWSWITVLYWAANAGALALLFATWKRSGLLAMDGFATGCLGMALGYGFLLPIHEHLHRWAYRLVGATGAQVRYDWRHLTAVCVAPGAMLKAGQFVWVCLAPLMVLNPVLAILAMFTSGRTAVLMAGALLLHTGAASGDIAFVNYVWTHRGEGLVTCDDPLLPVTRFYRTAMIRGSCRTQSE